MYGASCEKRSGAHAFFPVGERLRQAAENQLLQIGK
jgi:hypothetical protein